MASQRPLVLDGIPLLDFIDYLLTRHATLAILVVCGTKEAFLDQLALAQRQAAEGQQRLRVSEHNVPGVDQETHSTVIHEPKHRWSVPTLRLISTSRTLKLAFCPDITHLRACLTTHHTRLSERSGNTLDSDETTESARLLAILNPIHLHRPTSAFSAQGLNRTLSVAVEAAHHTDSQLIIVECPGNIDRAFEAEDVVPAVVNEQPPRDAASSSVWDEEVSILNVTTKSFGAGERGWVGRTVKLRTVAERWCAFQTFRGPSSL